MSKSIASCAYKIGLDLESTGLNVFNARFVELGAAIWKFDTLSGTFEQIATFVMRCRSPVPMELKSIQITGITQESVDSQPYTARDVLEKFAQFLNEHCIDQVPRAPVGYNIEDFDLPMIICEAERCGLGAISYFQSLKLTCSVDLLPICRKSLETTKLDRKSDGCASYNLGSVYKSLLGKPLKDAHGALVDAIAALEVLQAGYPQFFESYIYAAMSEKPESHKKVGITNPFKIVDSVLIKWNQTKGNAGKKKNKSNDVNCMNLLTKFAKKQQESKCPPPLEPLEKEVLDVE